MLKHFFQFTILFSIIFCAFTYNLAFSNTPLPELTAYNENLKDFSNWEIAKKTTNTAIAYSPDGRFIASGSGSTENSIRLWNVQSGEIINTLKGHTGTVWSIAYSPDGKVIASGSGDNSIRLWNAKSGKVIKTLIGHKSTVWSIAYSPDGKIIASGSEDSDIHLWDSQSFKLIKTLNGQHSISSIAYSPDGKFIASGSSFGYEAIRLWDAQSFELIKTLNSNIRGGVSTLAYSPDGKIIASGSANNKISFWNSQSLKFIKAIEEDTDLSFSSSLAYSPDGKVIASGYIDGDIRLWNALSYETIKTIQGHTGSVYSIAYSPDGKVIASGSIDSNIRLWNSQSGEIINTLSGQTSRVWSIAFSPDSKAISSGSGDNDIRLWNAQSGEVIKSLKGHLGSVLSVAYSPDGKVIASGSSDNTIRLWNIESGKTIKTINELANPIQSITYSPDGKTIATSFGSTIQLRDAQSGEIIETFIRGHTSSIRAIAYSPDGKIIASGSYDKTIQLWNSQSGEKIKTLYGHSNAVLSISFSADGKVITSGSADSTIRLWDVQSGKNTETFYGRINNASSIAHSPDDKSIAYGSNENSIRLWKKTTPATIKTMLGGTNGNWLTFDNKLNFKRSDNGSMLLRKKNGKIISAVPKSIKAVPKQSLSVSYKGQAVSLEGVKTTNFKLQVRNISKQPILWIKPKLASSKSFILHAPPSISRLESGQSQDLTVQVGAYLPYKQTKSSEAGTNLISPPGGPLQLQLYASEQTESNIVSIPVNVNPPKLELVRSVFVQSELSQPKKPETNRTKTTISTLTLSIQNTGQLPVGNMRFNLVVPDIPKLDEQRAQSELLKGEVIERAFTLPQNFKFKKNSKIDFQITTSGLPFFIWDFKSQSVEVDNFKWWIYLGLLILTLLLVTFVFYKKRYQHPTVIELSETPSALLRMPFEQLGEAQQRLTQTNRLDNILSGAGVSNRTLESAVPFAKLGTNDKAQLIAERLGAKVSPIQETLTNAPNIALYQLTFAEGFPLNIERVLLCFPGATVSEDVLSVLKHHPEAQARITLIMGADSDYQRQLITKAGDASNKWVAPQGTEITRLLLAPDAETALAEILAEQLSLQQISPYRIGGGVNNESVFFGRRELISQIINRDPANYLMAGGRQVGKSTLLKAIERRYADNPKVECVYLTLSSEVLVPRLASLLKLERTDSAEALATQLDECISESGQRFVFLIDEADRFISQEKAHDYAILNVFRRLSEEGNCTFILAGFWQLYQHAVLDYQSPIRNFGELLSVGELEKPACIELVTQPMKTMNLSYANETLVEHIVDSCGQRANLIAIACQHIVRNLPPKQRVIEAGDVDKALRSDELRRALSGWVVGETE